MALPLTVLMLGPDGGDALVAEWYHPDGTTVRKGEAVLRLETDFAAIEVETECDGVLRHRAEAGTRQPSGGVVAVIAAAGELLPGDAPPRPAPTEPPPPPKGRPRGDRRAALPLADVLRAAVDEVTASSDADVLKPLPWEAAPRTAPAAPDETPAPMLLFPRIVSELKEQAELEAAAEPDLPIIEMADAPDPPTRMHAGAWDLVPG